MDAPNKIEKIYKDLKKSGYPLEIDVLKILLDTDWAIIPQYVYEDPTELKQRTVDFFCYKRYDIESELYTGFRAALFIECKTIEKKPWVLFSIKKPIDMNRPMHQFTYLKFYEHKRPNTILHIDKLVKNCHYFDHNRISINHYIAFRRGDGKDHFYEALNQTLKSLIIDKQFMKSTVIKFDFPKIFLFSIGYPIIICDKELYEYKIEEDEIVPTDYILYNSSGIAQGEGPFLVDVMKLNEFPTFLERINTEVLSMKTALEEM